MNEYLMDPCLNCEALINMLDYSARDNCRRLKLAHDKCIAWAKRYGAKFAPDKYKLMHFTRKRRDPSGDLASSVRIGDNDVGQAEDPRRVDGP
jgi:hypothetical protein